MAFNDIELKKIEKALESFLEKRRPPPHIRPKLDIGYRISGQSVELVEIRPQWDKPSVIKEHPFAKASYVKAADTWKVYWQRSDLKWHAYEPVPTVPDRPLPPNPSVNPTAQQRRFAPLLGPLRFAPAAGYLQR